MVVAVVGNASPIRSFSREIDAADCVVRFNRLRHFGLRKTGWRTGIYCIRTDGGGLGEGFAKRLIVVHEQVRRTAESIWFLGGDRRQAEATIAVQGLSEDRCWLQPREEYEACLREFCGLLGKQARGYVPSSGMLFLLMYWRNLQPSAVRLYNFTFAGWRGHHWEAERKLVAGWQRDGRLSLYR